MFFVEILHTDTRWFKDYESQEKNYFFIELRKWQKINFLIRQSL